VGLADARDLCCWTGHRCDVLKGVLEVVETESDGEELRDALITPAVMAPPSHHEKGQDE